MQDKEVRDWLALHRCSPLSDSALRRLIVATSTPDEIYQLSPAELTALEIPYPAQSSLKKPADYRQLEQDYALVQSQQIKIIPLGDTHYPQLLTQISDPPPILYVRGNDALLNQPQLALVGSRHTSQQGRENAFRFAKSLASAGFTVTSGLALGIDTEGHRGALAVKANTVAVLGTGVDVVYPARNKQLYQEIVDKGAVISEFPLNTGPRRSLFPKRNRIISGMSLGVLVVEAALRSGSLITARCALEQGREVFAIPGSIHSTGSQGCHHLIQQGAKLVQNAADIMEELQGWMPETTGSAENSDTSEDEELSSKAAGIALTDEELQLIKLLGYDPAPIDLLQQRSGWPLSQLSALLTTLELKGLVENASGYYQRRI